MHRADSTENTNPWFALSPDTYIEQHPGSLKTLMCLQFLYKGAKAGNKGLYITFNHSINGIKEQGNEFGWDFEGLPVEFVMFDTTVDTDIEGAIVSKVKETLPKRIVVDSLTSYLSRLPITKEKYVGDRFYKALREFPALSISEDMIVRAMTTRLLRRISEVKSTAVFVYEAFTLESVKQTCEYLVDGVIRLGKTETTGKRWVVVEKMRYTDYDFLPKTVCVTKKGVVLEK